MIVLDEMGFSRDFYIFLLLVWEECDDDDSVKLNIFQGVLKHFSLVSRR
jgi:hypothetical protein